MPTEDPKPVIIYLADHRDRFDPVGWSRMDCLFASLKTVKLFLPPLPVIIFHEDYQQQDMDRIGGILPNVTFERVDFQTHRDHHVNHRPDGRVGVYGYCMMCRFFSGAVQAHPSLAKYTHYMRLDDDNYLVAPTPPEALAAALARDYTYAAFSEESHQSLHEHTKAFMAGEGMPAPRPYTNAVIYNNFHIASLALWRHPVVKRFTDSIENVHGCLKLGWLDASIHTMVAMCLAPAVGLSVARETRFSYRHNQQCVHQGEHTEYCYDGRNRRYPWGPPACLTEG